MNQPVFAVYITLGAEHVPPIPNGKLFDHQCAIYQKSVHQHRVTSMTLGGKNVALIKCGECGKEISDRAATYIGCGAPVAATATPHALPASANDAAVFNSLDDDLRS